MEYTQRLECTQDLYETHKEKKCPEQIGFLGICGVKHPVVKGPNKIGRDPHTCHIILNLNSVSRQHAVINVINGKDYMLMDLDSANKTKCQNKTLQPYIPHPLSNGDTIQFGDIFGIFRLLEEDYELPMTQVLDIPDTPAPIKNVSKLHKAPTTIIPESPDVSDRDDSFLTPQPNREKLRLSNSQFIKPFGKTLTIQTISSPKDNKKSSNSMSSSFLDNPNTSLNESLNCIKSVDIHELDTQPPVPAVNESTASIFTADTQLPQELENSPSIHSLNTQLPTTEHLPQILKIDAQHEVQLDIYAANQENTSSIFIAETQPFPYEKKQESEVELCNRSGEIASCTVKTNKKENTNRSEEELLFEEIDDVFEDDFNSQNILPDEIPINEIKEQIKPSATDFDVTTLKKHKRIKSENSTDCEDIDNLLTQEIPELSPKGNKKQVHSESNTIPSKKILRCNSDSSTDCEDIDMMPTQIIPELASKGKSKQVNSERSSIPAKKTLRCRSDNSTDCEDIDMMPTQIIPELPSKGNKKQVQSDKLITPAKRTSRCKSDNSTDCEDIDMMPTQIIPELPSKGNKKHVQSDTLKRPAKRTSRCKSDSSTDCEDIDMMPTQIISELPSKGNKKQVQNDTLIRPAKRTSRCKSDSSTDCEDIDMMPTQIIPELPSKRNKKQVQSDKKTLKCKFDSSTDCEDVEIIPTQKIPELPLAEIKTKEKPGTSFNITKSGNSMNIEKIVQGHTVACENKVFKVGNKTVQQTKKKVAPFVEVKFEDMPTQVIENYQINNPEHNDDQSNIPFEDRSTQIIETENIEIKSPFKVPLRSSVRYKNKEIPKMMSNQTGTKNTRKKEVVEDENYYNSTQDVFDDLCSQRETSPEILQFGPVIDDFESYKIKEKFDNPNVEVTDSVKKSSQQLKASEWNKSKKFLSDSSDIESTPIKVRPIMFTESDLPSSQEIKSSMTVHANSAVTDWSSDSEIENYSEEITPFLCRKKKAKSVPKIDLTKKFEIEKLPERVLTRQRKPTPKLKNSTEIDKKLASNILKSTYLVDQEDQIDQDIITENIKRLKTYEKLKNNRDPKSNETTQNVKGSKPHKKIEKLISEPKEKIKVKIERPKRKESSNNCKNVSTRKSEDSLNETSTCTTTIVTRTRGRKKELDDKKTDSKPTTENSSEKINKRKYATRERKVTRERSKSPEIEVRRPKRQKKN